LAAVLCSFNDTDKWPELTANESVVQNTQEILHVMRSGELTRINTAKMLRFGRQAIGAIYSSIKVHAETYRFLAIIGLYVIRKH